MASDTPGAARRYRAFITYSHADARWAAWLHRRLESYRLPRRLAGRAGPAGPLPRKLGPLFRDREELATATDLGERIEAALAASDALIVVCSPAAARSRWVDEEVRRFQRSGRTGRIFCLIVGGEPLASDTAGRDSAECFPPALRQPRAEAGGRRPEPLAADVRPGGDGRHLALLKLVAGLLGLNLDELRRREQQRRARRWAAVAVAALVVMTATSLLALEATIQRRAAERRQKQAEALVGFMLGNFTDKLRQLGRLDLLSSLDEQAMQYFRSLPPGDVSQSTLAQRAKALEEIGETRWDQGDYARALAAFQAELAITSALVQRHPRDAQRRKALGENLGWIGYAYWYQNDTASAERAFGRAVDALRIAAALAPADTDIQINLAYAHNNLGHIAELRGEHAKARTQWLRDLTISLELATAAPDNLDWQDNLGDAYDNLGKLALSEGDFVEAVGFYRAEQRIVAALVRKNASNQQARDHLVRIDGIIGRTLYECGQWPAGLRYLREAVAQANDLVEYDATQTGWRNDRGHWSNVLARMLLDHGDADGADSLVRMSLADYTMLTRKDPNHREWWSYRAAAQLTAARIAQARHDDDTAYRLAAATSKHLEQTLKTGEGLAGDRRTATYALLLLADLANARGDRSTSGALRAKALKTITAVPDGARTPADRAARVAALLALGDKTRAVPAIRRLWRMGYRSPALVARLVDHGIAYPSNTRVSRKIARLMGADTAIHAGPVHAPDPASSSRPPPESQGETP